MLDKILHPTTSSTSTEATLPLASSNNDVNVLVETKSKLTIDEFFDYTTFPYMSFSPAGRHLLFQTQRPSWKTNSSGNRLWLYDLETQQRRQVTRNLSTYCTPQWSPTGNWLAFVSHDWLSLYRTTSNDFWMLRTDQPVPDVLAWSNDSSLYFSVTEQEAANNDDDDNDDPSEWKDVIRNPRRSKEIERSTIYRLTIELEGDTLRASSTIIRHVQLKITELVFVPFEDKVIFATVSTVFDDNDHSEIYSLDLRNVSALTRLANNIGEVSQLQLSRGGQSVLYALEVPWDEQTTHDPSGIYLLNLTDETIKRFGESLNGDIQGYAPIASGGVYILEQWQTHIRVWSQQSPTDEPVLHSSRLGTYESILSSSNPNCRIAVVHSMSQQPMEIFCTDHIDHLQTAEAITNDNRLFTQRHLPQTKTYHWFSDDHERIEGILHYPPGEFESMNFPLLVLIHGGPEAASTHKLEGNYYDWAPLAASQGWLVLEPNYRGSTGYGSRFTTQLRRKPLSLAGRDILTGIDQLIQDGIADPHRLAVGGCSHGGSLTNWLITQTDRFRAALSCAGSVEFVSDWGAADDASFYRYWFDGLPWQTPQIYHKESPIYYLDRVRTPTHICTGANDVRVPASQSYMLERGLASREIAVQLLVFSNEGHSLSNPWYGKIKVREELKWLKKYAGGGSSNSTQIS